MVYVQTNSLLHANDLKTSPGEAKVMLDVLRRQRAVREDVAANAARITPNILDTVHTVYGDKGVFNLVMMAVQQEEREFPFFLDNGMRMLLLHSSNDLRDPPLEPDNRRRELREGRILKRLHANVLRSWLSRVLYLPGNHPGYLVYGFGGPRILVSHPFYDVWCETYDVVRYSANATTELYQRGYNGVLLYLDYLAGLNRTVRDIPAWLAWFSLIAVHSDLVVFIEREGEGLTPQQRMEAQATPDRVRKKLVRIPAAALGHRGARERAEVPIIRVGEGRILTVEESYQIERVHSEELIEEYVRNGRSRFRDDRIYRYDGPTDRYETYPLGHPLYDDAEGKTWPAQPTTLEGWLEAFFKSL